MLDTLSGYQTLLSDLKSDKQPVLLNGLSSVQKSQFISALEQKLQKQILVITKDEASARRLCDDYTEFSAKEAGVYPLREFVFRNLEGASGEYEQIRLGVLHQIQSGDLSVVFLSVDALMQSTIPPHELAKRTVTLETSQEIEIQAVVDALFKAGYTRRDQVDGISQFAVRGGIIDFFPPHCQNPVRVEFWGDQIDSMSYFEIDSQRRTIAVDSVMITPAREVVFESDDLLKARLKENITQNDTPADLVLQGDLLRLENGFSLNNIDKYLPLAYEKTGNILDYMESPIIIFSEFNEVSEFAKNYLWQHNEDMKILLEEGVLSLGTDKFVTELDALMARIEKQSVICMDTFVRANQTLKFKDIINITTMNNSPWNGDLSVLCEDLESLLSQDYAVVVLAGTQKAANILAQDLQEKKISADYCDITGKIIHGKVLVSAGNLTDGFDYPENKVSLITTARIIEHRVKVRKKRKGEEIRSLSDLTAGDYVVHISHGIGIFEGIVKMDVHGVIKDYIKIRYAGTDTLYVPVTQLDLVSKYIGGKSEEGKVKLHKLNSTEWKKAKTRVKSAVSDMADELIKLYSKRMQTKGYAFDEDNDWQNEFEARFPYQETEDQLRCIDEIKGDMQSDKPMDRLLCGDVGFGKTEVALRAAFKCVLNSKQCAVLCPTTILAWQHYQTFLNRIGNFPVKVELLSRFRTAKQQKEIVKKLKTGEIDIVIGTHRVVSDDVEFHDLGLAIIDEEQRFGVGTKEKFKHMFAGVDVLTLSATPIPRTLNMAMSGIRDMSVIEEAPQNRFPVQSYVIEHDMSIVIGAINKELRRGGQVYYIHNRIDSIYTCAARIAQLLPDAKIAVAHGRLSEEELSDIWQKLIEKQIDILVCTTIIETGVDVPNCNTLIVEDADRMGLSQLYQLRGRVGRSNRRAFAYFTFTRGKVLTEISAKRLSTIREFTKFGSGFRIALRDLEIRGAGNLLGGKQHGHMESVGYDMYVRLLSEAISEKKGEKPKTQTDECLVDIQITAHIPENYIENLSQRIDVYRKIASIKSKEDSYDVIDELIDRFGEPPSEVKGLIDVALVRNTAAINGFTDITQRADGIYMYTPSLNMEVVQKLIDKFDKKIVVNASAKPYVMIKIEKGQKPIDAITQVMEALQA